MKKYPVKNKFHRDPTSEKSDMYEFKIALFDNGKPEELLLFMRNFKIMLEASGTISTKKNLQYFCKLLHGEVLHMFDSFYAQVGSTTTAHLNRVIMSLGT